MDALFQEFFSSVPAKQQGMISTLDELFHQYSCEHDVKSAKSGYVVSYFHRAGGKKTTIANFVFRKTGMKIRIYAANIAKYQAFLNTLPSKMKAEIAKSSDCKRLFDDSSCNPKCPKGYAFMMDGVEYKKCRNMAFMPALSEENIEFIQEFLKNELSLLLPNEQ